MEEVAGGVDADAGVSDLDVFSVTSSDECCRFNCVGKLAQTMKTEKDWKSYPDLSNALLQHLLPS